MERKLFTDLIEALGKVAGGLKAIVNLPKVEREAMRHLIGDFVHEVATDCGQCRCGRSGRGNCWIDRLRLE